MKKFISLVLAAVIMCVAFPVTDFRANATDAPTLSVADVSGSVGETVDVDVNISENPGIIALLIRADYNRDMLELVNVTDGGLLGADTAVFSNDLTDNPYSLSWADALALENHTSNGVIATLTFRILGNATGKIPIDLSMDSGSTFDKNLNNVDFVLNAGSITVVEELQMSCIAVANVNAVAGENVDVPISILNNPGIVALEIGINYDSSVLTLQSVENGVVFDSEKMETGNDLSASPYKMLWEDGLSSSDNSSNGTLAILHFTVNREADVGNTVVNVVYNQGSTFNVNLNEVSFSTNNGVVTIDRLPATESTIRIENAAGFAGNVVEVPISILNNPGIVATKISVNYDAEILSLIDVENGNVFDSCCAEFCNNLCQLPYNMLWEDGTATQNNSENGTLAVLKFRVKDDATIGSTAITVQYDVDSTFDLDLSNVYFACESGAVSIDKLSLIAEKSSIQVGESLQVTAIYGSTQNVANVTWTTSDSSIATVDKNGIVTGKRNGNVRVKATNENGISAEFVIQVLPTRPTLSIFSYSDAFFQKVKWWKLYSSATIQLGYHTYNIENAAYHEWTSDNPKVKIDKNGLITNTGLFSRSAKITLLIYDSNGDVIAKSSVKIVFFKFNWQRSKLQLQAIDSDDYYPQLVVGNPITNLISILTYIIEKAFSI